MKRNEFKKWLEQLLRKHDTIELINSFFDTLANSRTGVHGLTVQGHVFFITAVHTYWTRALKYFMHYTFLKKNIYIYWRLENKILFLRLYYLTLRSEKGYLIVCSCFCGIRINLLFYSSYKKKKTFKYNSKLKMNKK